MNLFCFKALTEVRFEKNDITIWLHDLIIRKELFKVKKKTKWKLGQAFQTGTGIPNREHSDILL